MQKQSLTCETDIEKGYYNHKDRRLKFVNICIHCGDPGSSKYLLETEQLRERCMSNGYQCFPICIACLDNKKSIVHKGKKDQLQAKKEKAEKAVRVKAAKNNAPNAK